MYDREDKNHGKREGESGSRPTHTLHRTRGRIGRRKREMNTSEGKWGSLVEREREREGGDILLSSFSHVVSLSLSLSLVVDGLDHGLGGREREREVHFLIPLHTYLSLQRSSLSSLSLSLLSFVAVGIDEVRFEEQESMSRREGEREDEGGREREREREYGGRLKKRRSGGGRARERERNGWCHT